MEATSAIIGVILILICVAIEFVFLYEFFKDSDNIPTSLYYKKISRLQKEIEKLTEKKEKLKIEAGYFDKLAVIEKEIKAKKKEIKRVKVHIKIEDDSHKY